MSNVPTPHVRPSKGRRKRCKHCHASLPCSNPICALLDRAAVAKLNPPAGRDVLEKGDPDLSAILRDQVLATARKARDDVHTFFEFVMRDFSTRKPVRLVAHQHVALDFVMDHDRVVNIWGVGLSKTWLTVGLTLFFLGRSPDLRGAVVSASEEIAGKILRLVRDYIDQSAELRLVFPQLVRSTREGDPWTQTAITVERPMGIKDATLTAYGIDSDRIIGSRLSWVVIDDILNEENTASHEQREKIKIALDQNVLTRLDPVGGRVILTNTPWHPEDLVGHCRDKLGWATLQMDILGDITIFDDVRRERECEEAGLPYKPWDSPYLRPADKNPRNPACRLVAHDPDPKNSKSLWPERYDDKWIAEKRRSVLPHVFNCFYRGIARADETARCKQEYIDRCLKKARDLGIFTLVPYYKGPYQTYTGIDLAISPGEEHDDTAFFTFEARPGGINVILDIEVGQWSGPQTLDKMFEKAKVYNSVIRVENVAAQDYLRQFALQRDQSIPIKGHTTEARAKAHPEHGVEGLFVEMSNGAWAIPNSMHGDMHSQVLAFCNACLNYVPSKHTADVLMACVAPGAMITTKNGLKPIESVVVGEEVLTHKSRWRRVTKTMCRQHRGEAIVVDSVGRPSFVLTPEHPVWSSTAKLDWVTRTNRVIPKNDWEFRPAEDLRSGALAKGHYFALPQLPVLEAEPDAWCLNVVDEDMAMFLGLFLAEGSSGHHQVQFALHQRETHLIDFVRQQTRRIFGNDVTVSTSTHPDSKGIVVLINSVEAMRMMKPCGKFENKRLPWSTWHRMSQAQRLAMARGWMMGDGCYNAQRGSGRLSGVSISRDLLLQMMTPMYGEGWLPTLNAFLKAGSRTFQGRPSTCRNSWKLALSQRDTSAFLKGSSALEQEHWGTFGTPERRHGVTDRTNSRQLWTSEYPLTRPASLERVPYDGLVYNFHVEEDESYCVEGVAVHNCYFARAQKQEWQGSGNDGPDDGQGNRGITEIMSR